MNRSISSRPPVDLPPSTDAGRTRILFLGLDRMGWSTYATSLVAATARRADIDAVHIRYTGAGAKRAFSVPIPGGRNLLDSNVRRVLVARWLFDRWLSGPLDLRRFDVVHVVPQLYGLGVVDAAARTGTPFVAVCDATVLQEKGELGGRTRAEVAHRWQPLLDAERKVFGAADLVLAASAWAAAGVAREYGVPPERLVTAPFAIAPGANGERPIADPVNPRPRIVFVGSDWKRKGGDRLLRWHQQHWSDTTELHLCTPVAPPSGCRNVFHHAAMSRDLVVTRLLPSMDIFVLPTWNDMSPHVVGEAAAAGLPVVASAIGGITEMVVDGTSGLLLAPSDEQGFIDALDRLLGDPELRREMGAAARRHVERSTAEGADDVVLDHLVALGRSGKASARRSVS
jgi:glycosyltransferase involved in cell wall biosynthesis